MKRKLFGLMFLLPLSLFAQEKGALITVENESYQAGWNYFYYCNAVTPNFEELLAATESEATERCQPLAAFRINIFSFSLDCDQEKHRIDIKVKAQYKCSESLSDVERT